MRRPVKARVARVKGAKRVHLVGPRSSQRPDTFSQPTWFTLCGKKVDSFVHGLPSGQPPMARCAICYGLVDAYGYPKDT